MLVFRRFLSAVTIAASLGALRHALFHHTGRRANGAILGPAYASNSFILLRLPFFMLAGTLMEVPARRSG